MTDEQLARFGTTREQYDEDRLYMHRLVQAADKVYRDINFMKETFPSWLDIWGYAENK